MVSYKELGLVNTREMFAKAIKGGYRRKERYDRAIKWLEGVQAGRIVPDLRSSFRPSSRLLQKKSLP